VRRTEYPAAIRDLIQQLRQMPGVGPRSAERIALWIVQAREEKPEGIARAIAHTRTVIHPCVQCGFFATEELCEICADESRVRCERRDLGAAARRTRSGAVGRAAGVDRVGRNAIPGIVFRDRRIRTRAPSLRELGQRKRRSRAVARRWLPRVSRRLDFQPHAQRCAPQRLRCGAFLLTVIAGQVRVSRPIHGEHTLRRPRRA